MKRASTCGWAVRGRRSWSPPAGTRSSISEEWLSGEAGGSPGDAGAASRPAGLAPAQRAQPSPGPLPGRSGARRSTRWAAQALLPPAPPACRAQAASERAARGREGRGLGSCRGLEDQSRVKCSSISEDRLNLLETHL